jgi:hypothetical protein
MKKLPKTIFEIKVHSWNKRTKKEQDIALVWIHRVLRDLEYTYRKYGLSDEFSGKDK